MLPSLEHRLDHAPALFHELGTLEEGLVAEHDIAEEPLVALAMILERAVRKFKMHATLLDNGFETRCLGPEIKPDAGRRLQVEDQLIGRLVALFRIGKESRRGLAEGDHDFRQCLREPLAGAQIEGHS